MEHSQSRLIMKIKVKVFPSSGKQEVSNLSDGELKVYLKSEANKNKANIELLKILKKHFKKQVRIKSGFISRNKVVEIID